MSAQPTVPGENGARPVTMSCVIATTPWAGSRRLCEKLRSTRLVGLPRDYFNPLEVVRRSRAWRLLGSETEFVPRYLAAVREMAMGENGVLSVNLPWSHHRWLTHIARTGLPAAAPKVRSDAEVLHACFPHIRYLHMSSDDKARQAVRWYLARSSGMTRGEPPAQTPGLPDYQEIRWMEALICRQERSWESYFQVHEVDPFRVEYEMFVRRPNDTLAAVLDWLGLRGRSAATSRGWPEDVSTATTEPDDRLTDRASDDEVTNCLSGYLEHRDHLSDHVGVQGLTR